MQRSITGIADALQSIADGKSVLNRKGEGESLKRFQAEVEAARADMESNQRLNEATQYYAEIENCTSRIAARLREIDSIDLKLKPEYDNEDADPVSNQKRFIEDQCFRAQSLLTGEYYLRNLHTQEVNSGMADLDERITYTAKNWKHSLNEIGINESDLVELQPPALEATQEMIPEKSDSRKVRRNSVVTQVRPSVVAVEADYSGYNAAELSELNEILSQFMDQTFLNGANGHQLSREVMDRCIRFKNKILGLTNKLVEDQRRSVKSEVRQAQRAVRSLESEIALLHSQNDEADQIIRTQKESDKQIRKLVEAKFADSLQNFADHMRKIDAKLEAQREVSTQAQKRFQEVQSMYRELQSQRLHADPFVRRRAENLVKGLLRNLNESDLKEQEEREAAMLTTYQQWKKTVEFCTEKEHQLELMRVQETSVRHELEAHTQRIEEERAVYRQRVKVLKSKDDEQSAKLRILEETLSEKARNERRKLFFHETALSLQQRDASKSPELVNAEDSDLAEYEARLQKDGEAGSDADSEGSSASRTESSDGLDGSGSDTSSETEQGGARGRGSQRRRRVKQPGVRTVAPLCDQRTEAVLGVTFEHTKRQEITTSVSDHIPRPAVTAVTGSEATDSAALAKAQKLLNTIHATSEIVAADPGAYVNAGASDTAPSVKVDGWIESNSAPRTTSVKFNRDSYGAGATPSSPKRRQSTYSSSKVKFGFWAEAEAPQSSDSSGGYSGSEEEDGRRAGGSAGAVSRGTSRGTASRGGTAGAPGSAAGRRERHRDRAVAVHSLTSTACYVSLYYRYLKKFPNLNFRRDNPRLEQIGGDPHRASSPSRTRDGQDSIERPVVSEIVENNNRFQFSIKEGLIVVKEAIDALFAAKCIDRPIVSTSLDKVEELERRLRLIALPGEEPELRYQLHYLCVSLIHSILSRAPQLLLLKNSRKLFVEIHTSMLALLGVVLNCSLVFWQPAAARWNPKSGSVKTGGVAAERVEFICAHLIELVLTQGDIDHRRPLGDTSEQGPSADNSSSTKMQARSTSSKTFRAAKPADTPMGPAGFISLLRIQTGELLRKEREKGYTAARQPPAPTPAGPGLDDEAVVRSHNVEGETGVGSGGGGEPVGATESSGAPTVQTAVPASQGGSEASNVYRKGAVMNYHELFQVFNVVVDEDSPIDATVGQEGMFTVKHRNAMLALQLFLYLALGNREVKLSDAILMLHKGIQQHQEGLTGALPAGSADSDSVIPCDVDILLQSMHPSMVPALLSMELLRRVLEEEFRRVSFLKKIAAAHPEVADLQYLNVQFPGRFDVGLRTGRRSANTHDGSSKNMEPPVVAVSALAPPEPLSHLDLAVQTQGLSGGAETAVGVTGSELQQSGMRVTRFKSTKEAHIQWVEDLESQLQRLSSQVCSLIGATPMGASGSTVAVKPPACLGGQPTAGNAGSNDGADAPTIPLPVALVYRLLAHINTLRTVTTSRSVNGLSRVQALEPQFISIMRDLLAARSRILSIVKAMTWPMRKKLDWLKMKYNTILEENAGATKEVSEFNKLVEKYEADIAAYKTSLLFVDREKHTIEYRRTRMLQVGQHDPQIQSLIVEHCTDEYAHKLAEVKAREARLNATIAQFSNEFNHLNAQSETLKAAQRSLNVIEQAQTDAEKALDERPGVHTPVFDPLPGTDDFETLHQSWPSQGASVPAPAKSKAAPVSDFLQAVEAFVKTERMAEAVVPSAFADKPHKRGQEELSAKRVVDEAKAREKQRRLKNAAQERAVARPRLPLFGTSAQLQGRQQKPSLPSKLLGFAQRIDSGLTAVGAHGSVTHVGRINTPVRAQRSEVTLDISDSESDTGSHHPLRSKASHRSLAAARSTAAGVYTDGMDKEGMQPDLFGQRKPKSLRERIQQQMLRKGSGKYTASGSGKLRMHDILSRYLLSDYGGPAFEPQRLQQEPSDDALGTSDSAAQLDALTGGMVAEVQGRRPVLKIPTPQVSRERSEGYIQMPALEQIGRKELAYMSSLNRSKKYHYKEVAYAEVEGLATPLDVKSLIAEAIRSQREAVHSRGSVGSADRGRGRFGSSEEGGSAEEGEGGDELLGLGGSKGSSKKAPSGKQAEFTDEVEEEHDEDQFDDEEGAGLEGTGSSRGEASHVKLHSSRDQNVGHGISYAEYLVWKAKRRQQQQETQRLEALKNALNIQMRNARRNKASVDASAGTAGTIATTGADRSEKVLSEAEFQQLVHDVSNAAAQLDLEEGGQRTDYSRTNSEVDFILSRCSSRAESVRQNRKFSNKKRGSFGGALHFNTALLDQAASEEDGAGSNSAVTEANRRARGESLRSARASLSLRTRATLIQKLGQLLDAADARRGGPGGEVPLSGALASRQSMRHSIVDSLGTIPERSVLRTSMVGRKSMYAKGALATTDLPLEEAHIIAHTIVHGVPPPPKKRPGESDENAGSGSSASLQTVSSRINRPFGSRFDMQILNYIANDQLILSGWEDVDLLAMNDNETFSGHSFRFDDVDDRARAAMLKEFAASVAVTAEKSASAVENEYRAAMNSLNSLAGKKTRAEETKQSSPKRQDGTAPAVEPEGPVPPSEETGTDLSLAVAAAELDVAETAVPSESAVAAAKVMAQKADRHRHHHAILAGVPEELDRSKSYQMHHGSQSIVAVPSEASLAAVDVGHSSTQGSQVATVSDASAAVPGAQDAEESQSSEDLRPAAVASQSSGSEQPRRPSEPKPSANFASPRKKLTVGFH